MKTACYLLSAATSARKALRERAEIERWLASHSIATKEVEWYFDRASDTSADRPELGRLERDIASGNIRAVVLWKLSDLVTRFRAVLTMLNSWCERGVRVVVVSQGIDLPPEKREIVSPLLQALAETELEFRRERQQRGIDAAKVRGRYPGRKPGATKEKPHRAHALRGKGYTVAEIAEMLGVSKRTAFRYLGSSQDTKTTVASKGPNHES